MKLEYIHDPYLLDPQEVLCIDLETTLDHNTIWMVGWSNGVSKGYWTCPEAMSRDLANASYKAVVAHNGNGFDYHVLKRVWGVDVTKGLDVYDTINMASLWRPGIVDTRLATLAPMLLGPQENKGDFTDFDGGLTPEMIDYCLLDCHLTHRLWVAIRRKLQTAKHSAMALWIEQETGRIIKIQERNGFLLDVPTASILQATWSDELAGLHDHMVNTFPPTEVKLKTKTKYIPFNPGSRQQAVDRLKRLGWVPYKFTPPTPSHPQGQAKLDEDVIEEITQLGHEIAVSIGRYHKISKAVGMVRSWLEFADSQGRVHGRVATNGAVTGRMTHSKPNLGQIPIRDKEIGPACREVWTVRKGYKLLGVDASGLEGRMLAHYVNDPEYTEVMLTDCHTRHQQIVGLKTRDDAKTWFYAYLYGAGDRKLGTVSLGPGHSDEEYVKEGARTREAMLSGIPGLLTLLDKLERMYDSSKREFGSPRFPGLDGRRLEVRSKHSRLNTLLQGAGAAVMKMALILCEQKFKDAGLDYMFVVNVHDEFQIEIREDQTEVGKELALASIREAGEVLGVRCPLAGEAKVGNNWHDTH